ncbi:MAG TPA: hypothetical protein VHE78_19600 [Gemmatimonadaceae bacterium]|nr:hypothetical protein [Gemmatimonadaceae bacterium]
MKGAFLTVIASAALASPVALLAAPRHVTAPNSCCAAERAKGPDTARVRVELATADSLNQAGRLSTARRRYRALIDEQRAADQYPAEALWHLANSYFYHDQDLESAATLEELAEAAGRFGDPATELRASFQAAVLYQQHRQPLRVAPRVARIRALLQSPVIADEIKKDIAARLVNG